MQGGPGGMASGYGGAGMSGQGAMGGSRGARGNRRGGGIAGLVSGRNGSLTGEATDSPITVKSTTDTRIVKVTRQ